MSQANKSNPARRSLRALLVSFRLGLGGVAFGAAVDHKQRGGHARRQLRLV